MSKRKLPSDNVLKKHFTDGLNSNDVAKLYNTSRTTAWNRMKKLGFKKESPIGKKGSNHSQWKGGRGIKSGYWTVFVEGEHHRKLNIGRVYEHILIAEKKIGRPITKKEPIHHIDFNRLNNDPDNLYVCSSNKEHMDLHYSLEDIARDLFRNGIIEFKDSKYQLVKLFESLK